MFFLTTRVICPAFWVYKWGCFKIGTTRLQQILLSKRQGPPGEWFLCIIQPLKVHKSYITSPEHLANQIWGWIVPVTTSKFCPNFSCTRWSDPRPHSAATVGRLHTGPPTRNMLLPFDHPIYPLSKSHVSHVTNWVSKVGSLPAVEKTAKVTSR